MHFAKIACHEERARCKVFPYTRVRAKRVEGWGSKTEPDRLSCQPPKNLQIRTYITHDVYVIRAVCTYSWMRSTCWPLLDPSGNRPSMSLCSLAVAKRFACLPVHSLPSLDFPIFRNKERLAHAVHQTYAPLLHNVWDMWVRGLPLPLADSDPLK